MLFMVIERFKDRDPAPIYARLREQGRSLPDGLRYVDSWVEANFDRCFQIMEATTSRCSSGVAVARPGGVRGRAGQPVEGRPGVVRLNSAGGPSQTETVAGRSVSEAALNILPRPRSRFGLRLVSSASAEVK